MTSTPLFVGIFFDEKRTAGEVPANQQEEKVERTISNLKKEYEEFSDAKTALALAARTGGVPEKYDYMLFCSRASMFRGNWRGLLKKIQEARV